MKKIYMKRTMRIELFIEEHDYFNEFYVVGQLS
jgi:hypothetical protein